MKKLLFTIALLVSINSFCQTDTLVDVFDEKRNVIKMRATPKEVEQIKQKYSGKTLYIQKKVNGKWWECKYVRLEDLFKLQTV